ncbi:hypothetical protein QTJ16_003449 [Diplocarpon rosae]|uniref:Uncharacterized protein n=1 Tax=Diplocarpon rosae TaxID=946125 RepID=A0AAD9WEN7_9HELO|nr:hypothetical protein QTJ16_003449 [Diplocarpon rosae]
MEATLLSRSEMLELALSGQENNVPAAEERAQDQEHRFLSLAPATSASYPVNKATLSKPADAPAPATAVAPIDKARRSSSLSSAGSLTQNKRFLKLGPVHFGSGDGDWSEEVVE